MIAKFDLQLPLKQKTHTIYFHNSVLLCLSVRIYTKENCISNYIIFFFLLVVCNYFFVFCQWHISEGFPISCRGEVYISTL